MERQNSTSLEILLLNDLLQQKVIDQNIFDKALVVITASGKEGKTA